MEQKMILKGLQPWQAGLASAALVSIVIVLSIVLAFGSRYAYGWTVFTVIPILLGAIAALLVEVETWRPMRQPLQAQWWALLFTASGLVIWRIEGLVCLAMAAPLAIPLSILGAWGGHHLQLSIRNWRNRTISVVMALGAVPVLLSTEAVRPLPVHEHVEATEIIIQAPPEVVWQFVGRLGKLPPPKELLFRVGIAYPTEVLLDSERFGSRRICRLSTGDMPETVSVWEPAKNLSFNVLVTPPSMKESNPFGEIHPQHLNDYFVCEKGEFRLEPLPGGRTKLTGTSWYHSRIEPDAYWVLWTDSIVEAVHQRVMREIQARAEKRWYEKKGSLR